MDKNSLSHTSWECVYHIVWIPKYRRKVLYGEARREIGEILAMLVERMDGVEKVEGGACPDHMHVCLRIAPKPSVSNVVGKLKGKSATMLHERHPERRRLTGRDRTLWARGYYASTVGLDESVIRRCIQRQPHRVAGLPPTGARRQRPPGSSRLCRSGNKALRAANKAPGYAGG